MRRKLILLAALAAPAIFAALAFVLGGSSGGKSAAQSSGAATETTLVTRRTLAERLTTTGTIGYAGESTVLARLSGTITALPRVGDVIHRGEPLYAVAGRPVLLMYGEVPAYRRLGEGVPDGEDVRELERNLAALGFAPGTVDAEFTSDTAAALGAWQESLGLKATGALQLGRVAFLPGPRRVTKVEATLGEAIGGGGGGGLADEDTGVEATAVTVAYVSGGERAGDQPEGSSEGESSPPADEGGGSEKGEGEEAGEEKPADGGSGGEDGGGKTAEEPPAEEEEAASVPVLQTSSTRRIVSVELEAEQQSVARRRGQRVEVILPGGAEVPGRVQGLLASEGSSEEGAPGSESEPGVEVTVALGGSRQIPALEGAAVSVVFIQRMRKNVLAVPLTALLAIGGDRFAVLVRAGAGPRRIEVSPGLAADGYVEVQGEGLRVGMRVEIAAE